MFISTPFFSFLVRALDLFMSAHNGAPPLSGHIPDLTATTEQYVLLQQAYQSKARADLDKFTVLLHSVLQVSAAVLAFYLLFLKYKFTS